MPRAKAFTSVLRLVLALVKMLRKYSLVLAKSFSTKLSSLKRRKHKPSKCRNLIKILDPNLEREERAK